MRNYATIFVPQASQNNNNNNHLFITTSKTMMERTVTTSAAAAAAMTTEYGRKTLNTIKQQRGGVNHGGIFCIILF